MMLVKSFSRWRYYFKYIFAAVTDFVFPPLCLICHDFLMKGGGYLCGSCFSQLDFIIEPYCIQCAIPFSNYGLLQTRCMKCTSSPPSWRQVRAIFIYNEASKALIFPFKYHGNIRNILLFSALLYKNSGDILKAADFIIPVPLHLKKIRQRGYNQSALLAKSLAEKAGTPLLLDWLKRVHFTRPLASLALPERKLELEKAIIVTPHHQAVLKNKRIILVDDILTTGITAEICTKALLEAGCLSVDIFVIARTPLADENQSLCS